MLTLYSVFIRRLFDEADVAAKQSSDLRTMKFASSREVCLEIR